MKEIMPMVKNGALVFIFMLKIKDSMRENGRMMNRWAMESASMPMEINIVEISIRDSEMGMENIIILMEINMRENGKKMKNVVWVLLFLMMESCIKVNF